MSQNPLDTAVDWLEQSLNENGEARILAPAVNTLLYTEQIRMELESRTGKKLETVVLYREVGP